MTIALRISIEGLSVFAESAFSATAETVLENIHMLAANTAKIRLSDMLPPLSLMNRLICKVLRKPLLLDPTEL